jgi:presenilin 1
MQSETESQKCKVCSNPARFLCSSCGPPIYYCTIECQSSDWNNGHKDQCVAAQVQQAAAQRQQSVASSSNAKGRGNAAQNINSKNKKGTIDPTVPIATAEEEEEEIPLTEEEEAQDMKFYMEQIYLIIKPVMVCIVLSIIWYCFHAF